MRGGGSGRQMRALIERTLELEDIHWPIFFEYMEEIVGTMSYEGKQALKISVLELKIIRLQERVTHSENRAEVFETALRDLGVVGIIKNKS